MNKKLELVGLVTTGPENKSQKTFEIFRGTFQMLMASSTGKTFERMYSNYSK